MSSKHNGKFTVCASQNIQTPCSFPAVVPVFWQFHDFSPISTDSAIGCRQPKPASNPVFWPGLFLSFCRQTEHNTNFRVCRNSKDPNALQFPRCCVSAPFRLILPLVVASRNQPSNPEVLARFNFVNTSSKRTQRKFQSLPQLKKSKRLVVSPLLCFGPNSANSAIGYRQPKPALKSRSSGQI